ncbi:MAG: cyclic nucleotide-binding domain-containing protein [Proteocatella sp.]
MVILNNEILKKKQIEKYNIDKIFTLDMSAQMKLLMYKKHEFLCKEDEVLDYLIFLTEGKAKSFVSLENGKNLLTCFYEDFQVIGDLETLSMKTASGSMQALKDSYCIGIPMEFVRTNLIEDAKFLRFICENLGKKLHRCAHNSSINSLYPLENRLAAYILKTSDGEEKLKFEGNLTEVAELLGSSYRHLLRTLEAFCNKKYLNKQKGIYEVIDRESLNKLSAEVYL